MNPHHHLSNTLRESIGQPTRSARPVFVTLALTALTILPTHAQTPPDAGALLQQIERERQHQLPQRMAPQKPALPAAMKPAAEVIVTVKEFSFAGNTLMTAEQLAPAVANYRNRSLDFAQLQAAAAAVAEVYRAAGWVVNVYLPQQDIRDGIVTLQVVEAVFGGIKIEGAMPTRVSSRQIETFFTFQQQHGASLNADALDRGLLLADDLPGITVAGSLVAGSQVGETDLALKLADEPFVIGEAALDNTGDRSTGSERLTANLSLTSPLGFGDLLTGNVIHSRGNDYLRLGYTVSVGSDGWRVGGNAYHLAYDLIAPELNALNAKGTSDSAGLEASYPIIRKRLANLYLNLNYDHRRFDNESSGVTTTRYDIDATSIALNGNEFDSWGGGGASAARLAWVGGKRHNQVGTTSDRFSKLRYSLSRQQVIANELSVYASLTGQESNKILDGSERFYLGGAYGVRAYPSNEASGDSGVVMNLEMRWRLPDGFSLAGLYDYGHVRNNDAAMSYSLKGYGLSLGWQTPVGANFKATWAHRIGENPNPTTTGKDQDGSLDKNRLWLSASLPF